MISREFRSQPFPMYGSNIQDNGYGELRVTSLIGEVEILSQERVWVAYQLETWFLNTELVSLASTRFGWWPLPKGSKQNK